MLCAAALGLVPGMVLMPMGGNPSSLSPAVKIAIQITVQMLNISDQYLIKLGHKQTQLERKLKSIERKMM